MKRLLLASALLIAVPAFAQDPSATPFTAPGQYTLTLTAPEIAYVARVLQQQPYHEVFDLLNKIQGQIDRQKASPSPQPKTSGDSSK